MSSLIQAGPPYFIVRDDARKQITTAEYAWADDVVVRKIRGQKSETLAEMMNEFGAALQFFDGFGENWHALEELLCYLDEWLPALGYVLVVTNADRLLEKEQDQFEWFVRVLNDVGDWWARPAENNDRFDRPPYPFKVVLEAHSQSQACAVAERIQVYGTTVAVWSDDTGQAQ
jgi:hypothetical protein